MNLRSEIAHRNQQIEFHQKWMGDTSVEKLIEMAKKEGQQYSKEDALRDIESSRKIVAQYKEDLIYLTKLLEGEERLPSVNHKVNIALLSAVIYLLNLYNNLKDNGCLNALIFIWDSVKNTPIKEDWDIKTCVTLDILWRNNQEIVNKLQKDYKKWHDNVEKVN